MYNHTQLDEIFSNLSNWKTLPELAETHPQFTYSQLKHLFWKRDQIAGLKRCSKRLGRRLYVNEPAFALWLSGSIGDQP